MQNTWIANFRIMELCPVMDEIVRCTVGDDGAWLCSICGIEH
jgi:hypothetical protein